MLVNIRDCALTGALFGCAQYRAVLYFVTTMRFKIPGQDVSVRLFERVETTDGKHDIFDVGLEQGDGSIDSIAFGGSFSYARSLVTAMDKKAEEKKADTKQAEPQLEVVTTAA